MLKVAIVLMLVTFIMTRPLPGRGPRSARRDVWRGFRYAARDTVMRNAGYRCEASALMLWGRCTADATEVDHIHPWSRGGPTVVSNGQALCRRHNRAKAHYAPPWWYVLGLERRRLTYFPAQTSVRVMAVYSPDERVARDRWAQNRGAQSRWRR